MLGMATFDFKANHFSFVFQHEIHLMIPLTPVKEVDCIGAGMIEEVGTNCRLNLSAP